MKRPAVEDYLLVSWIIKFNDKLDVCVMKKSEKVLGEFEALRDKKNDGLNFFLQSQPKKY